MAAPHVTGAWAALKQIDPNATVDDVLAALQSTGEPIVIPGGQTKSRLKIFSAAGTLACPGPDSDGDGIGDDCDNCPQWPNFDQTESALIPGIGSACLCGDAQGDGVLDTLDSQAIQSCALGIATCPALADTDEDGLADTPDALNVQQVVLGFKTPCDLHCTEAPSTGLTRPACVAP